MLKIKPPNYKYCPFCGGKLTTIKNEGKEFKHCEIDRWTYFPSVDQSAVAIIINGNKILLVRRNRKPYEGTWMFPGGFLSYGESPEETIIREIKEETGLSINRPILVDVIQTTDDPRSPGHLVFFYLVKTNDYKIGNLDNEENSETAWFDISNPPIIGWKSHKQMVARLQSKGIMRSK